MTTTLCPVLAEPELRALLLAARHSPECDTIRGAIADWLEEHAGTEECAHCAYDGCVQWGQKCKVCGGSHYVPNLAGQWAELIRVGVELGRHEADREASGKSGWRTLKLRSRVESLRARQSALLPVVEPRLRRVTQCRKCGGQWNPYSADDRCKDCDGTGYTGVLNTRQYNPALFAHDLHWQRGLPYRADARIAEWWDDDRGKPSKFARRVVAWMPCLTELWVTDLEPRLTFGFGNGPLEGKDSFDWRGNEQWGDRDALTPRLFAEVGKEADYYYPEGGFAEFATPDRARSALGRALARLARREGERADEVGERHAERITAEINRLLAGNPDPETVRLQDEVKRRRRARE